MTFPVVSKVSVLGEDQHPLYSELTKQVPTAEGKEQIRESLRGHGMTPSEDPDVLWNFEKFLIARDGTVVGRYAPAVAPDDSVLVSAIDGELAKPALRVQLARHGDARHPLRGRLAVDRP